VHKIIRKAALPKAAFFRLRKRRNHNGRSSSIRSLYNKKGTQKSHQTSGGSCTMFLKKSRFTKNGNLYEYYKIVETYKDESGRSKHRVVKHLGKLTEEDAAGVRQVLKEQGKRTAERKAGTSASMVQEAVKKPVTPPPQQVAVLLDTQSIAYKPYDQKDWNVTEADMLLLVRGGTGELYMNGRKIELVYGLVVYAPAGSGMFVVNTGSGMLQLGRMTVEAIRKSEQPAGKAPYIQERFAYGFPEPVRLKSPYPVMQLFKELHSLYENGRQHDVFRRQLLFYRILDMLLADIPDNGGRETGGDGRSRHRADDRFYP